MLLSKNMTVIKGPSAFKLNVSIKRKTIKGQNRAKCLELGPLQYISLLAMFRLTLVIPNVFSYSFFTNSTVNYF